MAAEFDYIVVGAGSAGCIVASRLTEDPSTRVLLVEAGGSDHSPIIAMPGALPFVYQSKRIGWGYQSGPEPHLGGKTIDEKAGKVIGGTSSINAMIYNRGNPMDYDGWADDGLADWDYAHCLPYFRKMETFSGGPDEWRGGDGPLHISRCQAGHKLYDAFLRSGEQAGFEVTRGPQRIPPRRNARCAVVHPQRAAVEFIARLPATGRQAAKPSGDGENPCGTTCFSPKMPRSASRSPIGKAGARSPANARSSSARERSTHRSC